MPTLEETMILIAEEHRKLVEANRNLAEENRKLVEEHRKFSEELREFKEENRIGFEELRKNLQKSEGYADYQWGRFVEALVNNQLIPLFQSRNIPVNQTSERVKGCVNGRNFEFDIIAENGDSIVVVGMKSTLRVKGVKKFLNKLPLLKIWKPLYANMKMYAAVAFVHDDEDSSVYAENHGLFTILATGSSAKIINPPEFEPKEF